MGCWHLIGCNLRVPPTAQRCFKTHLPEPFDYGMHAIFFKGKYIAEDKVITMVCEVIIVCIHISECCLAKTDVENDYRSGKVSLSIV